MRIGAIEAGGTKFVCGIGNEEGKIEERISFPTEEPERTLDHVVSYFKNRRVNAIGIGSFGPINIDKKSPLYGYVTTTPKSGWSNYNFIGKLKQIFDVPFGWDTDVNAAALGEVSWGVAKGLDSCVYYTIGTGIGLGVFAEGKLVHGLMHPEGGHVLIKRHPKDTYTGNCPYHGDCLEGMAAGPSLKKRWGKSGNELPADHPVWEMEAFYIAQAITGTILTLSPKKIIMGGGVMHQKHILPMIRAEVQRNLNSYINATEINETIQNYIVPPGLGDDSGLCGALALGMMAYIRKH